MARVQHFARLAQARVLRDFLTTAAAALALCYFGTATSSDRLPL